MEKKIMQNSRGTWIRSFILNEIQRERNRKKNYTHTYKVTQVRFLSTTQFDIKYRLWELFFSLVRFVFTLLLCFLSRPANRIESNRRRGKTLISKYHINLHNWLIIEANYPIAKWSLGLSTPVSLQPFIESSSYSTTLRHTHINKSINILRFQSLAQYLTLIQRIIFNFFFVSFSLIL